MLSIPSRGTSSPIPPVPEPYPGSLLYVGSAVDEGEHETTSDVMVEAIDLDIVATMGLIYIVNFYGEIYAPADEDVEIEATINGFQHSFGHFKNQPYDARWAQMNGGFWLDNEQGGPTNLAINFRSGYGAGIKKIRRTRILVYSVVPTP